MPFPQQISVSLQLSISSMKLFAYVLKGLLIVQIF